MPKANSKGQKVSANVEELINQFNAKIREVQRLRPDIAEIQPLERSVGYKQTFWKLSEKERNRAIRSMREYLITGAEERSEKYANLTEWGAKSAERYVRQANETKTAYFKSPFLKDINKSKFRPDFEHMSPESAKRAIYALEKQTEQEAHLTNEGYKKNYMKAIAGEVGMGRLYSLVDSIPAEVVVAAYYYDPDTFEIKFWYSMEEKAAKEEFVYSAFLDFIKSHTTLELNKSKDDGLFRI